MSLLSILAQDDGGGGAAVVQLGILLMIPLAMYFLMIRPQRRRMREQQSMQRSIEVGDEVVTTSGMYGFVTGIEDNVFWLEIDDDVQIRIARAAVQSRVHPSATSDVADDDVAKSDPQ
jgi:preprotein translocase subunit YajC